MNQSELELINFAYSMYNNDHIHIVVKGYL